MWIYLMSIARSLNEVDDARIVPVMATVVYIITFIHVYQ